MKGAATFTHDIPAAPTIIFPQDGAVVDPSNLVVRWDPVGLTLTGAPLTTTGYEVIVTKLVADDPNGFSRPTFDVHLPPSQTRLTVPSEFLEPRTPYELEGAGTGGKRQPDHHGLLFQYPMNCGSPRH